MADEEIPAFTQVQQNAKDLEERLRDLEQQVTHGQNDVNKIKVSFSLTVNFNLLN